jgi:hypothetical protein
MACFETGTVITLSPREALSLPDVRGATLRVTHGTLWLTQERDRHDIVLRPGDNWVVESNGNTVVEAQNDAMFCIVGRQGARLRLPANREKTSAWLSRMADWFATPPRQVPYV